MDMPNEILNKIFFECTPCDVVALSKVNKRIYEVVTSGYFSDEYWLENMYTCGCGEQTLGRDDYGRYSPRVHHFNHDEGLTIPRERIKKRTWCEHVACRKCLNAMLAGKIKKECPICSNDWSKFVGNVCLRCLRHDAVVHRVPRPGEPLQLPDPSFFGRCEHAYSQCFMCARHTNEAKACRICIDNIKYGRGDAFKA